MHVKNSHELIYCSYITDYCSYINELGNTMKLAKIKVNVNDLYY